MDAAENPPLPRELVFVDLETTGGSASFDRITEIGIVRVVDGETVEEWSTLINPERRIAAHIEALTGISNEMVAAAPRFGDVAAVVAEKLAGAPFVAHNARFDYSFLRGEFRLIGRRFAAQVLCTVKLSRRLFPAEIRHNLDAVMQRHGLACAARHRALGDARVIADFWLLLCRDLPQPVLARSVAALLGTNALPAQLDPTLTDELPEGPGVYRFLGEGDAPLYIGKSASLRTRVLQHFAGEHGRANETKLARQVRRIDWRETAGELGASLLEAEWIRAQKPLYNRRLRGDAASVTLAMAPGSPSRVEIVPADAMSGRNPAQAFGLFRSRKDALRALEDIARAQALCLKALGLEQSEGSCLAFQVGKCRGACVGREDAIMHRVRLELALSSLKLKCWPFPGRIALRERGAGDLVEYHVCEDWAYLGSARSGEELAEFAAPEAARRFDADVYRILARHVGGHARVDWVDLRGLKSCA